MTARIRQIWARISAAFGPVFGLGGARDAGPAVALAPGGWPTRLAFALAAIGSFLSVLLLALTLTSGRPDAPTAAPTAAPSGPLMLRLPVPDAASATPPDTLEAALALLADSPGIASARVLDIAAQQALLEPVLGPDLPLDALALPGLIEMTPTPDGPDLADLRNRIEAALPGAVLEDHRAWHAPQPHAAGGRAGLAGLGWLALGLIAAAIAATMWLCAEALLAANRRGLRLLRQMGTPDRPISVAVMRRLGLPALAGAALGSVAGWLALRGPADTDLATSGPTAPPMLLLWLIPLLVALLAALAAHRATRTALRRVP